MAAAKFKHSDVVDIIRPQGVHKHFPKETKFHVVETYSKDWGWDKRLIYTVCPVGEEPSYRNRHNYFSYELNHSFLKPIPLEEMM